MNDVPVQGVQVVITCDEDVHVPMATAIPVDLMSDDNSNKPVILGMAIHEANEEAKINLQQE